MIPASKQENVFALCCLLKENGCFKADDEGPDAERYSMFLGSFRT